jgi:hypothetical protein
MSATLKTEVRAARRALRERWIAPLLAAERRLRRIESARLNPLEEERVVLGLQGVTATLASATVALDIAAHTQSLVGKVLACSHGRATFLDQEEEGQKNEQ